MDSMRRVRICLRICRGKGGIQAWLLPGIEWHMHGAREARLRLNTFMENPEGMFDFGHA
jgi:hypothetical protein